MSDLYQADYLKRHLYHIDSPEQDDLLAQLKKRTDPDSQRLQRYLALPDLSRTEGSPLHEIVERVKNLPTFSAFDVVEIPEIVPASISFDLFDFPADHPARSHSDTYYVDNDNILRTHDTVFWHYYLNLPEIKERLSQKQAVGAICYGKVYRKDEIDRHHGNIFHQLGAWFLLPDDQEVLTINELKDVLGQLVKGVFGPKVEYRFNEDVFPYTDPSLEMEIKLEGEDWVEVVGGGMPKKSVLKKIVANSYPSPQGLGMGLEGYTKQNQLGKPDVSGYNGWAFGFGLERLAIISMNLPDIRLLWSTDERVKKQLVLGQKFIEVSKYPSVTRDISFVVGSDFEPNNYFELVREVIDSQYIEEIQQLDRYEDEQKFGPDKISYTYRIVYRRLDRTLTNEEVDKLHHQLEERTIKEFKATIR